MKNKNGSILPGKPSSWLWRHIVNKSDYRNVNQFNPSWNRGTATGDIYECNGSERAEGAGRPKLTDREMGILEAIEEIVSGAAYGAPSKVLIWTTLILRKISGILESNYSIRAVGATV